MFTCTSEKDPISVKHLECSNISEALAKKNAIPFHEIGPSFSLRLRRDKLATLDLFKEACRKPKIANLEKKKARKNKFTNVLGETKGKVYVQQQDLKTIKLRKFGPKSKRDQTPNEVWPASLYAPEQAFN